MGPNARDQSGRLADNDWQGIRKFAREMSETIGAEFFSTLVKQLASVLGAECLYIGELLRGKSDRVRTLAVWVEGSLTEAFEFPLAGSPCGEVALGNTCVHPRGVRERFPEDSLLRDLTADACAGIPLNDSEGQVRGMIAALFRQPIDLEIDFVLSMLKMFAQRASAELSRKQAEDLLRESEQRYRTFVELNPDACWRVEFDEPIDTALPEEEQLAKILQYGWVAECNVALVRLLGLERPDQVVGAAITDAVQDKAFMHDCLRALVRSGYRYSTLEVTTIDRNGKRANLLHTHWAVVESGRIRRVWGSSRDITELREIEAQFRHAQKLDELGRLAAGVAHDFNNLLTVIRGYSSQLLDRSEKTDDAYVGLGEILKAADKAAALSNQLLTFSRKQSTEHQLMDLTSIVAEDEQMLRRLIGKNIELKTDLTPSLWSVRANAGCMHQVLLNLVVNARDAMPNGGRLLITLSNLEVGSPPPLATVEPGPYVRLSVTDNGIGMSSEVKAHLFEPFFTTKEMGKGSGLGLSTVYGIVRQSGGHIVVESEIRKGTTFEILLPREISQQDPAPAPRS